MSRFTNEAQRIDPNDREYRSPGSYGFECAPRLLLSWGGLFQVVISQAGTYALTGKFHDQHCAIFKCEGGCKIAGVDDLVLKDTYCHWDWSKHDDAMIRKMAALITDVALAWDPENPIDSMIEAAAKYIGVAVPVLRDAIDKSDHGAGNPFRGNSLSDFFDYNPFGKRPVDRDYERFCMVKFEGKTEADVDLLYADQDLGESLLERINAIVRQHDAYGSRALSCSPKRDQDGNLKFWVNTGTTTQIDGWQTRERLEAFIAAKERLERKR